MTVLKRAYDYLDLQSSSPALVMLRTQSLYFMLAVFAEYFPSASTRVKVPVFHESVNADLEALEERHDFAVPARSGGELAKTWINMKVLARRQDQRTGEEYYELTAVGQRVMTFVNGLVAPRVAATQSRLAMVTEALSELDYATNPDQQLRLKALLDERKELDAEIERVESGQVTVMSDELALESVTDLANLAREVPEDFLRVREAFHTISNRLRQSLLDADTVQEHVLNDTFYGYDAITTSDEGRSFDAFMSLLQDDRQVVTFEEAMAGLEERGIIDKLGKTDQDLLRGYLTMLLEEATHVNSIRAVLARNLREFVQSRQFVEYRALNEKLQRIQRLGMKTSERLTPTTQIPIEVALTSFASNSVGRISTKEPAVERIEEPVEINAVEKVDLDCLKRRIRESEIDFDQLVSHVNTSLDDGPISIAGVLDRFPAEQGLASIVGLLMLAMRHGHDETDDTERVRWVGQFDAVEREGIIPRYVFERRIDG